MRILLAFPLVSALLCAGPALAQAGAGRCDQLRAELDRLGRPVSVDETRIAQYQGAIDRQSDELQRTTEYAQSLGCDIEGGGQCVGLQGNIRRMQRNLAVLQSQYSRISANAGDQREDERQRLLAMLDDLRCDGASAPSQAPRSAGLFEKLFGPEGGDEGYALPPSAGDEPVDLQPPADSPAGGTNLRTICVRKCDGFFFPISFSTNSASFPADTESCRKQCPTAEVELYYYDTFSQAPDDAISTVTGEALRSMPNAFKFRTKFDQSCGCKPAGQGVAAGLSPAEEALRRLDAAGGKAPQKAPPPAVTDLGAEAGSPTGAPAATGPSPPPQSRPSTSLPTTAGSTSETTTPDGQKKKVRVVGPSYAPTQ